MSDLTDLIDGAFDLVAGQVGNTITYNGVSKTCVATPISRARERQETGYMPEATCIVEMRRSDFAALAIPLLEPDGKRTICKVDGEELRLIGTEPDEADTIIRLSFAAKK